MSSYYRLKHAILRLLLSGVIYEYKCPRGNSTYRYLYKRLEEHLHMSTLMGKPHKRLHSFAHMLMPKLNAVLIIVAMIFASQAKRKIGI